MNVGGRQVREAELGAKLFCRFCGAVADGAAEVMEDENPDDAAMEKTGPAVTPFDVAVLPLLP